MDVSSEEVARKAPVVRFVDLLLSQAVKRKFKDNRYSCYVLNLV
jgi:hypothetical protein